MSFDITTKTDYLATNLNCNQINTYQLRYSKQFPLLEPGRVGESSRNQGEREEELKRLRQQLQELEQRIENATEVLMQSPNLKDRFIPKIQSDEDKIRKVKTEIETRNLASAPTGVDLESFRGEMEQAL